MEDQLWKLLYWLIRQEYTRRPRQKSVQYTDDTILAVAFWAVLHDRPRRWACDDDSWKPAPFELPSQSRLCERLKTLSVQLLLEQVFYRLLAVCSVCGFCLCRRMDSKPLCVGGFSKDHDARRGYATGGMQRGYKLICCWGKSPTLPEAWELGPLNYADATAGRVLVNQLQQLHCGDASGYVVADATFDTNPLHAHAGRHGLQMLTRRKKPGSDLGHRPHDGHRLRSIELLEPPRVPLSEPAARLGPQLYRWREQIERDYGQMCSFGGGLQPLPSWVRRPHRVVLWVMMKLIINALRICINKGLTP